MLRYRIVRRDLERTGYRKLSTILYDVGYARRSRIPLSIVYNAAFDRDVYITVNIEATGIAPGQSGSDIIERADKALYHTKLTGNTVSSYHENMEKEQPHTNYVRAEAFYALLPENDFTFVIR